MPNTTVRKGNHFNVFSKSSKNDSTASAKLSNTEARGGQEGELLWPRVREVGFPTFLTQRMLRFDDPHPAGELLAYVDAAVH